MSEEEGSDANPQGKLTSKNLLTVILEFEGKIRESSASRKMGVESETVRGWAEELEAEGFIELAELGVGDPLLQVTPAGLKKLDDIKREWKEQEGVGEEGESEDKPGGGKRKLGFNVKAGFTRVRGMAMDFVILGTSIVALYLLKQFIEDPNAEVLSFFFGAILLSVTFLIYNQYKKSLKTRKVFGFMQWFLQLLQEKRRYIATTIVSMLMIYAVGMLILEPYNRSFYIMLMVLIASTGMLIYYPKKTFFGVIKFYIGIGLLAYALMLIVNLLSITSTLFEQRVRLLDVGVGIALLVLIQMNEDWLGIKTGRARAGRRY
jgi:DNA-binding PadR family transcriptional regulator